MLRLLLLLLGSDIVRRQWLPLAVLGAFWTLLGLAIIVDALDGHTVIAPRYFGYLLLLEGLVALVAAAIGTSRRGTRLLQAALLLGPGIVIVLQAPGSNLIIAILLGLVLLVDGAFRIVSAHLLRFPSWRAAIGFGAAEILLALGTLQPWPTWYEGTIGTNVGALLAISGIGTLLLARRLRALPAGGRIASLYGHRHGSQALPEAPGDRAPHDPMTVRVWTPTGSAKEPGDRRPLIDRYMAAVDRNGRVSTGHAAIEMPPDLYISHYPAIEHERSARSFRHALRADVDAGKPGRFLPGYREEVEGWCEADQHVRFTRFDAAALRAFWRGYSADTTYHLTSRNCSTVVAHALDAALEGALGRAARPFRSVVTAALTPDIWLAGALRRRAEAMTWTPGLVLDYARLLHAIVEPDTPSAPPKDAS